MNESVFDDEELIWPEVNPEWNIETLLSKKGMFHFREVKHILDLQTIVLTRLRKKVQDQEVLYRNYGFFKPPKSQYVLRMSVFRQTYKLITSESLRLQKSLAQLEALPDHVRNANDLRHIKGTYALAEIMCFSPFKETGETIKKYVRLADSLQTARKELGVWYHPKKREYYVELPRFYEWFFNHIWRMDTPRS